MFPAEAVVAEHWLLDAPNLVGGSYVLPNSNFLPLPRQNYEYEESGWVLRQAGMLACSSPSFQRDQGECSELVISDVLKLALSCPFLSDLAWSGGTVCHGLMHAWLSSTTRSLCRGRS